MTTVYPFIHRKLSCKWLLVTIRNIHWLLSAIYKIQLNFLNVLFILKVNYFLLESWQKINNEEPVCFGAKDNLYGSFSMRKSGRLKTMMRIHRSGSVHCNNETSASYWGCTWSLYGENLMTIITDAKKKPVLPSAENLKAFNSGGSVSKKYFYSLPGYHHNSTELGFRNLVNPFSVSSNQEIQIWYGQDWIDTSEENNSGKACLDVFAWFALFFPCGEYLFIDLKT